MEPIPTESIVRAVVAANLEGRWLLDHPFYRRWEAGQLSEAELASYAGQYRHVERALPGVLADIAPTVLDLLGLATPAAMTGRDLLRARR